MAEKIRNNKIFMLLSISGIIVYSLLCICIITNGHFNCFFADDNAMQWGVVTQSAFDEFFSTGQMPAIDLYQYKGQETFISGYYSLTNPFMMISYLISRFIFSYNIHTISIYVIMMYILGNITMFLLLKETGIKKATLFISLFAYSGLTVFFLYSYYYFTFNNYFFIPLFIYVMLKIRGSKSEFFIPGIMLAFSLLLGHIQYTCYYVIVYCIMCVIFALQEKNIKKLIPMLLNIIIFAALSAPQLFLLMRGGYLRSELLFKDISNFFEFSPSPYAILAPFFFYNITPTPNINNMGLGIFGILFLLSMRKYFIAIYNDIKNFLQKNAKFIKIKKKLIGNLSEKSVFVLKYIIAFLTMFCLPGIYIGFDSLQKIALYFIIAAFITILSLLPKNHFIIFKIIVCVCILMTNPFISFILLTVYLAVHYFKKEKKTYSRLESIKYACIAAALFFWFFSMGKNTPIAPILSYIPVFNQFRFLYKCEFIFLPLMVFIAALELDKIKWHIRIIQCTAVALSAVAVFNTTYYLNNNRHKYINNTDSDFTALNAYICKNNTLFEENKVDKNNYRFLAYGSSTSRVLPIEEASRSALCMYTKNFPTAYELFVIAGYDNTFTFKSFNQSNKIMSKLDDALFCGNVHDLDGLESLLKNPEEMTEFSRQMIDNCIKYVVIYKSDEKMIDTFTAVIEQCSELHIVKSFDGLNDTIIFEIDGVHSLAVTESGEKIPLTPTISTLNFNTDFEEETEITLSFTYYDNYKCNVTEANGEVTEISPQENEYGFINLKIPAGHNTVTLRYKDNMADIAMACSVLTTVLTLGGLIFIGLKKKSTHR